ncbi:hypothetical protein [Micromonospora wenchangensis]
MTHRHTAVRQVVLRTLVERRVGPTGQPAAGRAGIDAARRDRVVD